MAERGPETLRYGPMKPVGLSDPRTGRRPYAVVQLRQDNALGTLFNLVGFQTKLTYGEQQRIFRMIPGLEHAEFARLGGLHRNTFINSPRLLDRRAAPQGRGRTSASPARSPASRATSRAPRSASSRAASPPPRSAGERSRAPPATTALGALLGHITGGAAAATFQPMNVNFGLFPPLEHPVRKAERKPALARRALADLEAWLGARAQAA